MSVKEILSGKGVVTHLIGKRKAEINLKVTAENFLNYYSIKKGKLTKYEWKAIRELLLEEGYSIKWNGKYHVLQKTVVKQSIPHLPKDLTVSDFNLDLNKNEILTNTEITLLRRVIELVKATGIHNFISYLSFEEKTEDATPLTEEEVYNTRQLLSLLKEQAKVFQNLK